MTAPISFAEFSCCEKAYCYGTTDVASNTGTSIYGAYGQAVLPTEDAVTVRQKIEAEVRRHSDDFVLNDDGSFNVTHTVPLMHSRSPWKGHRQVLDALWDQDGRVDDYNEGKEILKDRPRVHYCVIWRP